MITVNGVRYRKDDAERRGLTGDASVVGTPANLGFNARIEAEVAKRVDAATAELEATFEQRVSDEVAKRVEDAQAASTAATAADSPTDEAKAVDPVDDAKKPVNKAARPATK